MKTITMDYEEYQKDLNSKFRDGYTKGYSEAVGKCLWIITKDCNELQYTATMEDNPEPIILHFIERYQERKNK